MKELLLKGKHPGDFRPGDPPRSRSTRSVPSFPDFPGCWLPMPLQAPHPRLHPERQSKRLVLFDLLICTPFFFLRLFVRVQDISGTLSLRSWYVSPCSLLSAVGPEARSRAGGSVARLAVMPRSDVRLVLSGQLCFREASSHPCPLPDSTPRFGAAEWCCPRSSFFSADAWGPFPSCAVRLPRAGACGSGSAADGLCPLLTTSR